MNLVDQVIVFMTLWAMLCVLIFYVSGLRARVTRLEQHVSELRDEEGTAR